MRKKLVGIATLVMFSIFIGFMLFLNSINFFQELEPARYMNQLAQYMK